MKVHLYGLYLDLFLWHQPHYRAPTYRHDILAVSQCFWVTTFNREMSIVQSCLGPQSMVYHYLIWCYGMVWYGVCGGGRYLIVNEWVEPS